MWKPKLTNPVESRMMDDIIVYLFMIFLSLLYYVGLMPVLNTFKRYFVC